MKKLLGTVLLSALLFAPGLAHALEQAGIIDKVDPPTLTFTLQDGSQFLAGPGVKLEELTPGTEVVVIYEEKEGQMVASEVKPAS